MSLHIPVAGPFFLSLSLSLSLCLLFFSSPLSFPSSSPFPFVPSGNFNPSFLLSQRVVPCRTHHFVIDISLCLTSTLSRYIADSLSTSNSTISFQSFTT
ncbi:hypothetical protein F9C07_1574 [Aspergillus flavus]|uniref:Secreted protein n=1 Tax=Aspergillus flavus (strain ATCC 200026 / FGSC A1120 / IAM 13836 / NRRL 3357 / JCM 12722 / SRRC 167) TaxID=332952 RepID=A0A7U2QXR3_ASPFN|nr:hypothetical protein F9C07_1574 [Aspergillus flavus]